MKYTLIFLFFVFSSLFRLDGQKMKVSFQTGYGFYNMHSFSDITSQVYTDLSFPSKIISNYPAWHYYQPVVKLSYGKFDFGITYLYEATGSKISSKDYSGEYRFDTRVNSKSPGIILEEIITDNYRYKTGLFLLAGVNFSSLKMNEFLRIGQEVQQSEVKFESMSFYLEPGLKFIFPVRRFSLEANIGYFKELHRQDYSMISASQNKLLVNKNDGETDIWDGLRIGLGVSFTL